MTVLDAKGRAYEPPPIPDDDEACPQCGSREIFQALSGKEFCARCGDERVKVDGQEIQD
jgi:DNA-directed RNA polymerase subunit RPC12/RpoP